MSAAWFAKARGSGPGVIAAALATTTLALTGPALATTQHQTRPTTIPAVAPDQADHWGYYFGDQVHGDGDTKLKPTPIALPAPVAQIGTSNSTQYALLTNGQVWAWGQGTNGQLGNGTTVNEFTTAVQVQFPAGVTIAFLATDAMPFDTALAVDTNGNAWGWGLNTNGPLCLGNGKQHDVPVELPFTDVTALAGADDHAVYDADGTVYSCGRNKYGVLGDGKTAASTKPVPVSGLAGQPVTALYSAWQNAGALLANGEYFDWGFDAHGQLGDGLLGKSSSVPVQVSLPAPVTQVAQGGSTQANGQTIAMLSDGTLYAWGDDVDSGLGDGGTKPQPSPEQIFSPAGVTYNTLASGGATSYAITSTGAVYAWGNSAQGEVGNGSKGTDPVPVQVDSGASFISSTAGNVAVG